MTPVAVVIAEHKVGIGGDLLPALSEERVLWCEAWLPGIKEREYGVRRRGIYTVQKLVVQRGAGFKALNGALRLTLLVSAEKIGRVVAEKICCNVQCALDMRRDTHFIGDKGGLFAVLYALAAVDNVDKLARVADLKPEADLESPVPAGRGDSALLQKRLIVRGQSLQYHVCTSALRQSSTPRSSRARKNCAFISFGLE